MGPAESPLLPGLEIGVTQEGHSLCRLCPLVLLLVPTYRAFRRLWTWQAAFETFSELLRQPFWPSQAALGPLLDYAPFDRAGWRFQTALWPRNT